MPLVRRLSHLFQAEKYLFSVFIKRNNSKFDVNVNDTTGLAIVSMNRPPINVMNYDFLRELTNIIDDLSANRSRGMLLTSALPSIFSGGLDITVMYKPEADKLKDFFVSLQDCWYKLFSTPFPTAAAINGHSPAGGCLLAMSCEYRVMVEGNNKIGLNETALGMVTPRFFQLTMLNTISQRDAEIALTTGKLFSAEEALKVKLIDEIGTDNSDAVAKCEAFIGRFKKVNSDARMMTKLIFRGPILKEFNNTRDDDLKNFIQKVSDPKMQQSLGIYLEAMKNKK